MVAVQSGSRRKRLIYPSPPEAGLLARARGRQWSRRAIEAPTVTSTDAAANGLNTNTELCGLLQAAMRGLQLP